MATLVHSPEYERLRFDQAIREAECRPVAGVARVQFAGDPPTCVVSVMYQSTWPPPPIRERSRKRQWPEAQP